MHIALVGPIAGEDVRELLHSAPDALPVGYTGAPLTGILIGELLRLGHRVTAVTTDPTLPISEPPVRLGGPGFTFIVCPARPHAWRSNGRLLGRALDFFAFERRQIQDQIKAVAPDIVHAHWSYEFALAALDLATPHLITCHDSPSVVLRFTRSPYRALRYVMARRVFNRGREFTTVSNYMAEELAPALGYSPQVIPNPVAPYVLALGHTRSRPVTRRVAMVCNGWDERKNPEPALYAFARWREIEPTAELHLFGADFGSMEYAERWARQRDLTNGVNFVGRLPHREMVAQLTDMDALLHTSLEESFGVVLAEAMALGIPVVAGKDSGAVPWVLGADMNGLAATGILANVRSHEAITAALIMLFDEAYSQRSDAAVTRAQHMFAAPAVARAYEERYRRVLQTFSNFAHENTPTVVQEWHK